MRLKRSLSVILDCLATTRVVKFELPDGTTQLHNVLYVPDLSGVSMVLPGMPRHHPYERSKLAEVFSIYEDILFSFRGSVLFDWRECTFRLVFHFFDRIGVAAHFRAWAAWRLVKKMVDQPNLHQRLLLAAIWYGNVE